MIESKQNQQVKKWKKLHQKKYRDQEKMFLIEGWHLVEEAIKSNWSIETLIIVEGTQTPSDWDVYPKQFVSTSVMKEISQTETPQGIAAIVHQKEWVVDEPKRVLLLDQIQDPGNLGTIIRSGLAFDVDAIVLGKGSVDLYNEKVIRATQGGIFHLPVLRGDLTDWIQQLEGPVYGTDIDEKAKPLPDIRATDSFAVVLGNEGSGVSNELLDQCTESIYIPQNNQAESLNVGIAASIILYHFRFVA